MSLFSDRDVREHLLVMLVRDFGYTSEPAHGHTPLRHQFAWTMATEGMTPEEIRVFVGDVITGAVEDDEPLPNPYGRATSSEDR